MIDFGKRWFIWVVLAGLLAVGGFYGWQDFARETLPEGFASSNGRLESVEINVSTERAGRLEEIHVEEGDLVSRGQILARLDTDVLQTRLRETRARLKRANIRIETANNRVDQRRAELEAKNARLRSKKADLKLAEKNLERIRNLVSRDVASQQKLDNVVAEAENARGAVAEARAEVSAGKAALNNARSDVVDAEAFLEETRARVQRIKAELNDSVLRAPIDGRIQYRVAEPGEVLASGGTVLNLVDLTDVYMTFFLPTEDAGRLAIGSQARIVLDAAPQYVVPAKISFVSDVAQFTPKSVETKEERRKMRFRIKARVDKDVLEEHLSRVKTGLPGVAYVRVDPETEWPDRLKPRLPDIQ